MKIRKSFIRPKGAHCAPLQMLNDICKDSMMADDIKGAHCVPLQMLNDICKDSMMADDIKGAHCAPLQMLNDICTDQRTVNDRPYKTALTSTNKKCRRAKADYAKRTK